MSTNLMEANEQWRNRPADERYESLAELHDAVHQRRTRSRSVDLDALALNVRDSDGTIVMHSEGDSEVMTDAEPTHWSFGQMSRMIGAPADYLRTLPRELLVNNLRHGLKGTGRDSYKFMTVERDSGANVLQAVTSPTYGRIWDADVVDGVQRLVENSGGKWHNPPAYVDGKTKPGGLYASDHDLFIFMIDGGSFLESGDRAKLNRGFIMANSEVGAKAFWLMTFLHNGVCGNHIIWGAEDVNKLLIRHTSGGPTRFDVEAQPALKGYLEAAAAPVEKVIKKAQEIVLVPPGLIGQSEQVIFELFNRHGTFTRNEVRNGIAFAKAEEGDARTLWQLVQGLTAYARGFDHMDTRFNLEQRAGKLLDMATTPW